ncbi:uncharacterized protein Dwil_GK21600 [Drosophila willistoni]|nr:uncharacterized protein LOC6640247 [Drosophila willistoni]EDW74010.2 uncharacterized protein Dwil_GK21600 [Drosophila willistoni]
MLCYFINNLSLQVKVEIINIIIFGRCLTMNYLILILSCFLALSLADLRSDLRDFLSLVPKRRLNYVVARYYIFDPKFRQSIEYVRSEEFLQTWQQIRQSPDFMQIVEYVTEHGSGYDITRLIDRIPQRLRAYQLSRLVPVDMVLNRDLTTFLSELMQTLPRAQIYSLISRKVRENGDFAKLYKALRQPEFRQLVDKAKNSPDLREPLNRLRRKNINVDEIIQLVFELLSWGPKV